MERKIEPQLVGLKNKHTTQVAFFFFHFANCGFQFKQQNRTSQPKNSGLAMPHINSLLLESFSYQSLSSSIQSNTLRNQDMVTLSIDNTKHKNS